MKSKLLNFFKTPQNVLSLVTALFLGYMLFPNYFQSAITPLTSLDELWMSLDPSWMLTLSYANVKNLNWGNDFVFTCGPLSYLALRIGWGANKYAIIFYDLFIALNFIAVFYLSFKEHKNKVLIWIVCIATAIIIPRDFGINISIILLAFLMFWIIRSLDNDTYLNNVIQIIILLLLFYIKFNTGIVSFVFYFAAMAYKAIFKIQKKAIISGYIALLVVSLIVSAKVLNVTIGSYFTSGLEFVTGYNDAMSSTGPYALEQITSIIFILVPGGALLYYFIREKDNRYRNFLMLFFYYGCMFVLYKQSFVRADGGHVPEVFKNGLLFVLCIFPFYKLTSLKFSVVFALLTVTIPVYILNRDLPGYFDIALKFDKHYIESAKTFTPTSGLQLFPNNNQIPDDIKAKIGQGTVDIFPWNTHLLFENKLNYSPRPVMQSYSAYTPYLATMNFDHFNSVKAPQYVLYDYGAVDSRYPLFDDTKVNMALFKNYKKTGSFIFHKREILLLEKKADFKPITLTLAKEYALNITDPLVPKENTYYEVVVYNSLTGKIISAVERAPRVSLTVKVSGQQELEYTTSPSLLKSGLFLNKFVNGTEDFSSVMSQDNAKLIPIEYYKLKPKHPESFKDKIRIREYQIN